MGNSSKSLKDKKSDTEKGIPGKQGSKKKNAEDLDILVKDKIREKALRPSPTNGLQDDSESAAKGSHRSFPIFSSIGSSFKLSTGSLTRAAQDEGPSPKASKTDLFFVSDDGTQRVSQDFARAVFLKALSKSALLGQTSPELRESLFEQAAVPVFVTAGDVLFEQGTNGHLLFVLVEGKFKSIVNGAKKKSIKAKRAVAEHSVLMNSPHEYTLEAETDGMVLAVHRVQYQSTMVLLADRVRAERKKRSSDGDEDSAQTSDLNFASIAIFAPLSKAQLRKVKDCMQELTFKTNERLVASKQVVPGLFIIKTGQVALRAPREKRSDPARLLSHGSTASISKRLDTVQLFAEAEHDEIEWLTRGDYFGEASLISNEAQLGVDVVCSSAKGVVVQVLRREDWKRIVFEEGEGAGFLENIRLLHVTRLLSRSPVFSSADEKQIGALVSGLQFKDFDAGARIMEGGAPVASEPGMYLLTQGAVRLIPTRGLALTASQTEIAKRAQMFRESSHALLSKRVLQVSSASAMLRPGTADRPISATAPTETQQLERGSSFLGMSPSMFGRNVAEVARSQLDLLNEPGASVSSTAAMTTSLDHEALFVSLGISERDYVVLLDGELFGEEGISADEANRKACASVCAVGKVTVAFIPLAILEQLNLLEAVRSAALEEESEREEGIQGLSQRETAELASLVEKAQQITKSFMNTNLLRVLELKMQHQSLMRANQQPERRESVTFQLNAKRLWRVKGLHQTNVVDVALAAHDPSCQLLVVKDLDVAEANKQGMGSYVLREQVLLAQVSSNFVASMVSSWEEPERLYLALEPALAGDLERLLARTRLNPDGNESCPKQGELGGFDIDVLVFTASCLVLALKHLYEHQILHRDIKPCNVVMDHFGYCKLVDFGIAKRLPAGSSRTYTLCGSPKYMSPELVNLAFRGSGEPYTNAVDWWALGITLYELATGRLPYADPNKQHHSAEDANKEALLEVDLFSRDVLAATRAAKKLNGDYSLYESHSWFKAFKRASVLEYRELGAFIAKLLNPDPDARLGSATSKRGPREAQAQSVFKTVQFDRLAKKRVLPPFIPREYLVEMTGLKERVAEDARKNKIVTVAKHCEDKKNGTGSAAARQNHMLAHRPVLKRSIVESRVRANLEHPDSVNVKMTEALESTDQARKQQIMAGQQHIRRVAFKQGLALDEIDATAGARNQRGLVVMQRAAVLETLQVFVAVGGSLRARRHLAAVRIQTFWRGQRARALLKTTRNATIIVQRFVRAAKRHRKKVADAAAQTGQASNA